MSFNDGGETKAEQVMFIFCAACAIRRISVPVIMAFMWCNNHV